MKSANITDSTDSIKNIKRIDRLTAVVLAAVLLAVILSLAEVCKTGTRVIINDGSTGYETYTYSTSADDIISEQKQKLHAFDLIRYAGYNDDGSFELSIEHSPMVTINDNGETVQRNAVKGETVLSLLTREGIVIGERDKTQPSLSARLFSDCEITVTRAFEVNLTADGETKTVYALDMTVGELLDAEGIVLGESDLVEPSCETVLVPDAEIAVKRVEKRIAEKIEYIPYETLETETTLLKIGDSRLAAKGEEGRIITTTVNEYTDGVLTGVYTEDIEYTEPVTEVIARGTALSEPYSRLELDLRLKDGIPVEYERVLTGKVTSYTAPPGCGTYSGRPLIIGSCGVDPNVIPFGSELYIVSLDGTHVYGCAIASDTGYITDIIADVYMGETAEHWDDAMNWCAQECNVYVLKTGDNTVSWRDGVKFE